jgi:ribonucleoside-diphosphate reductase alpha chain
MRQLLRFVWIEVHSSAELLELVTGTTTAAPLRMTCGTKMRPAGSCHV